MKYDTFTVDNYFQNLDLPASVQKSLMDRLKLDLNTLSKNVQAALDIKEEALEACKSRGGISEASQAEWKKCEGTCNTLITNAVNQEIGSTAFMLKLLADSVIRPDGKKHRLKIGLDPSFFKGERSNKTGCRLLTGQWKDDAPFLHLVLPPSSSPNGRLAEGPRPNGRLVMGFGPSASGKTHWAKTILRLLAQADPQFPEIFFADDGGLVRESSAVYQFATEMAHCAGFAGFTNLHAGMFVTGDIKHAMEKYLLAESQRSAISLYVPETLAKCEFMIRGVTVPLIRPCESYLKTFLDITRDDKWIGLLIWQHATAADHMNDAVFQKEYPGAEYACVGCEASGKEREKGEGKPYEGKVYAQSMKNGRKYMELAPGGRYEIHNAGRPGGVSVMWDRSVMGVGNRFSEIIQKVPGIQYVDARVVEAQGAPTPPSRGNMRAETGRVLGEFLKERGTATPLRNAKAASESVWKNMPSVSEIAANPALREVAMNIEGKGQNPVAFSTRQKARRAAASDTGSVLRNVANKVYASRNKTRNATANAMKIRESSASLNAMKQAEQSAANAYHAEQQAAHSTRRITSRLAANAAEGTQEAAAKRLAALRAPSQKEQNAATAAAKVLTAERRMANAQRVINETRSALRNANASAAVAAQRQNSNAASAQNDAAAASAKAYGVMNSAADDSL